MDYKQPTEEDLDRIIDGDLSLEELTVELNLYSQENAMGISKIILKELFCDLDSEHFNFAYEAAISMAVVQKWDSLEAPTIVDVHKNFIYLEGS